MQYQVSDEGEVASLNYRQTRTWRKLTRRISSHGYHCITLSVDGKAKVTFVHRIVAEAFICPCPTDRRTVNHKDGNKLNNSVSNLEWVTQAENNRHCREVLAYPSLKGAEHMHAKSYLVTSPQGHAFVVKGLAAFCKANELKQCDMVNLAAGRRRTHRGWKCEHYPSMPHVES